MFWVEVISRWAHVMPAIALVGGAFFMRFAMIPGAAKLPEKERLALQDGVRQRWSIVVAACALLLLISGFYNITVAVKKFELSGTPYMTLIAVKFVLGLAIFFIASVLSGRSERAAAFREKATMWLNINLAMALIVVGSAGYLRVMPRTEKTPESPPAVAPAPDSPDESHG